MLRTASVATCLDKRLLVFGFEVPDLLAIFILLSARAGQPHAVVLVPTVLGSLDVQPSGSLFVAAPALTSPAPFDVPVEIWETRATGSSPFYLVPPQATSIAAGKTTASVNLVPYCGVGAATVIINARWGGATISTPIYVPYTACAPSGGGSGITGGITGKAPRPGRQQ